MKKEKKSKEREESGEVVKIRDFFSLVPSSSDSECRSRVSMIYKRKPWDRTKTQWGRALGKLG